MVTKSPEIAVITRAVFAGVSLERVVPSDLITMTSPPTRKASPSPAATVIVFAAFAVTDLPIPIKNDSTAFPFHSQVASPFPGSPTVLSITNAPRA